jgi:hypothetical protein
VRRDKLIAEFTTGWVEYATVQRSLLNQLRERLYVGATIATDRGGSSAKPKSKPPTDIAVLDLYSDCKTEVTIVMHHYERDLKHLESLRRQVRVLLGYDAPTMTITASSCHMCGGTLEVAQDASTDVSCTECGNVYGRNDWADILLGDTV